MAHVWRIQPETARFDWNEGWAEGFAGLGPAAPERDDRSMARTWNRDGLFLLTIRVGCHVESTFLRLTKAVVGPSHNPNRKILETALATAYSVLKIIRDDVE